ncbi:MAG: methionyl-tRNA formyltransferase [Verrucomicrobia bacterium]|nr:methionyl-tRNA formyltransferase [Verrucomicrobiota bacterium]
MCIVFIGTAEFGIPCLEALLKASECHVAGVVTQPDRPAGRRHELTPSPIKTLAMKHHLPVFQPEKIRTPTALAEIRGLAPDLIVVVAYGQILPRELLAMPRLGCVNVHASLLPRWRGASPIQAALLAGDTESGVTTMLMDEGLDTGPMLLQEGVHIEHDDNAASLHDKLAALGAELLLKTVASLAGGTLKPTPQPAAGVTYAPKIRKEDGLVDWSLPAAQLLNRLRAFTPWPGFYTFLPESHGQRLLKIWAANAEEAVPATPVAPGTVVRANKDGIRVATKEGLLAIRELQLEGSRRLTAADFLRGHPLNTGLLFRSSA